MCVSSLSLSLTVCCKNPAVVRDRRPVKLDANPPVEAPSAAAAPPVVMMAPPVVMMAPPVVMMAPAMFVMGQPPVMMGQPPVFMTPPPPPPAACEDAAVVEEPKMAKQSDSSASLWCGVRTQGTARASDVSCGGESRVEITELERRKTPFSREKEK